MTSNISEKEWAEDFKNFVQTPGRPVPREISNTILSRIHKLMHPSAWIVFLKILGIHAVVGTLSLAVCNQFGINIFNSTFSLSDYFMRFGESVCMTFCGFLFIGLSATFSLLLLSQEEFFVFRKNFLIQIFSLSLLSLVSFFAFGAEIVLSMGLLWLIGAFAGGSLSLVIGNLKQQST